MTYEFDSYTLALLESVTKESDKRVSEALAELKQLGGLKNEK